MSLAFDHVGVRMSACRCFVTLAMALRLNLAFELSSTVCSACQLNIANAVSTSSLKFCNACIDAILLNGLEERSIMCYCMNADLYFNGDRWIQSIEKQL